MTYAIELDKQHLPSIGGQSSIFKNSR